MVAPPPIATALSRFAVAPVPIAIELVLDAVANVPIANAISPAVAFIPKAMAAWPETVSLY